MGDVAAVPLQTPQLVGGAPIYVTGEESLQLSVFNSATGVTVTLTGRFLPVKQRDDDPNPRPGPFAHTLVPTTNRAATLRTEVLGEGWLLDWSLLVTAGAPLDGQCYAKLALVRGRSGSLQQLSSLG